MGRRLSSVPSIRIMSRVIPVVRSANLKSCSLNDHQTPHECVAANGCTPLFGMYDSTAMVIQLADELVEPRAALTLMHETIHAILDLTGLVDSFGAEDESFTRTLAPALLAVLRENPALVAYLTRSERAQ